MSTSYIYPRATTLSPYLTIKGCSEAIEFYKKAFDAKEIGKLFMPDGSIAHADLEIEGSLLMVADENDEWGNKSPLSVGGNPVTLSLYVKDVDSAFQKVVDAGAKVDMPVEDMYYGDRVGQVTDPFGYKWMIATHKKDVSYEELQKYTNEMFAKK